MTDLVVTVLRNIKEPGGILTVFSNLNGVYRHKKESATKFGVRWISWREKPQSLKRAEMKIRPVEF